MAASRLPWLLVVGLLAGCEQPAQPPQQHRELSRINRAKAHIYPKVTDGSPIRFGLASVETVGPNNSTLGSRSSWETTVEPEAVQQYFRDAAAKARPGHRPERVSQVVVRCSYFDEGGAATGSDDVELKFPKGADKYNGRIQFKSLGVNGQVARIDIAAVTVWVAEDGAENPVEIVK